MIVRDAQARDATAIAAFWNPQIRDSVVTFNSIEKSPEDIAAMIRDRPCFLVVEVDGTVAGFATYDQFRGGIGYAHTMEHTIILAPQAAGQGAGRALMQVLMARARAADVHTLWAGISEENTGGVAFHVALGFEKIAVLAQVGRKYGRWIDLVLMQKRL